MLGLDRPLSDALWLEEIYFARNRTEAADEIQERLKKFQEASKKRHAPRCVSRTKGEAWRQVFLYWEMESEAVRVLLPISTFEVDTGMANFKAALELGLRRKFGGEPVHLKVGHISEPTGEDGRRQFLMLYDAVPGGTGYLKELVKEKGAFVGLFELALKIELEKSDSQ